MKPTLEEVQAYFKNAKKVRGICGNQVDMSEVTIAYTRSFLNDVYAQCKNSSAYMAQLFDYDKQLYAEILSYEGERLTVSKEFILEGHAAACSAWKERIEQEFPDLFFKNLKVGEWYKIPSNGYLFCITDIQDCINYNKISYYGFRDGHWREDYFASNRLERQMVLATSKEVRTALINEAKRRGVWNVPMLNYGSPCFEEGLDYVNNVLWSTYGRVFDEGKWVTIIEQPTEMTLAEIEAKLGHSIKIVK